MLVVYPYQFVEVGGLTPLNKPLWFSQKSSSDPLWFHHKLSPVYLIAVEKPRPTDPGMEK